MFYGQIMTDPSISFCAIGDVFFDDAPLQITDFAQGTQIDQLISKIYLEGGGGKGYNESYELAAYFYLKCCEIKYAEIPYFFITSDETFYKVITSKTIKQVIGRNEIQMESKNVFLELTQKFNVFVLHKPYDINSKENNNITMQWKKLLGNERVIEIKTPKACIDIILGIIAITSGARTFEGYMDDLTGRDQTEDRIEEVSEALKVISLDFIEDQIIGGLSLKNQIFPVEKKISLKKSKKSKELIYLEEEKVEEKNIEMKKNKALKPQIPHEFFCPITLEIFRDPVILEDGNTYEKEAIEKWLKENSTSPITNQKLFSTKLIQNLTLRKMIEDWKEKNILGQF